MKSGLKVIVLAISCLTLASGCTKKNSGKANKSDPKVEEKKDLTGGIKDDPKPTATPPVTTPPPADDSNKDLPQNTPAAQPPVVTPPATTTTTQPPVNQPAQPQPQIQTQSKTDIQVFEDCLTPLIMSLVTKESEKNKDLITPKKLNEIKQSLLKQCQKPTSISVDQVSSLIHKKMADVALPKFPKSKDEIEAFIEIEESDLTDNDRKEAYDEIEKELQATANSNTAMIPTPSATPQPVVVPQPPPQNNPPTPQTTTLSAGKPVEPGKQEPAKSITSAASVTPQAPVAAKKTSPSAPANAAHAPESKETTLDRPAVAKFKNCYTDIVKKSIVGMKSSKVTIIPAGELFELKLVGSARCERSSLKDEGIDKFINQTTAEIALKSFPESQAEIKIFSETENKKLDLSAKRKIYRDLAKSKEGAKKSVKSPAPVAKPTASTKNSSGQPKNATQSTEPVELKDLPSFEKCLNENSEQLLKTLKGKKSELESPAQIAVMTNILVTNCKFKPSADASQSLLKVVNEKTKAHFPKSKEALDFYNLVAKANIPDELKVILLQFYNIPLEYKFVNTKLTGVIDRSKTAESTVTYKITKLGGEIQSLASPAGKEAHSSSMSLDKTPIENVSFVFDMNLKSNGLGSLVIIENSKSYPLEYSFVNGDPLLLRARENVTVAFSSEAWNQVMEAKVRNTLGIPKAIVPEFPIKYTVENQIDQPVRLCELTATEIKCADPNTIVRFKVSKESVNLPMGKDEKQK